MSSQKPTSGRTFKDVLVQAVHSLADSTGLQVGIETIEPTQRAGADAIVNVTDDNKRWRFHVEVKPYLTTHTLGPAIAAVSQIKKKHRSVALVSAYVNPSQADRLRRLGIEFFDAAGNASFQQKGLNVFITGRKPQSPKSLGRPARAFNPTGSRLVFALLCQPGLENKSYREIAKEAGISLGAVNWIMNDLKSLGHLSHLGARGRRLVNKKELLKRIYSDSNLPKLQAQYGLQRDPTGEVELLRRFWKFDQWDQKSLQTAPPLLVYADLVSTADERNLETAQMIYEQYVLRLVE